MKMIEIRNEYEILRSLVGNTLDCPGKGGNISIKPDSLAIWIKSSGQDLKNKDHSTSYVSLETGVCWAGDKPSMEIGFHRFISSKYVVHYHPIYVLPFICSIGDAGPVRENLLVPEITAYNFVGYAEPGEELSERIKSLNISGRGIIYLENHGVILHGDSIQEISEMYWSVRKHYSDLLFELTENIIPGYTPDDFVDPKNLELLIGRLALNSLGQYFRIYPIPPEIGEKLLSNRDEIYRQGKM